MRSIFTQRGISFISVSFYPKHNANVSVFLPSAPIMQFSLQSPPLSSYGFIWGASDSEKWALLGFSSMGLQSSPVKQLVSANSIYEEFSTIRVVSLTSTIAVNGSIPYKLPVVPQPEVLVITPGTVTSHGTIHNTLWLMFWMRFPVQTSL